MHLYRLDVIKHDTSENALETFGYIVIELPTVLQALPNSNEVDMRSIFSTNDIRQLSLELGAHERGSRLSFHLHFMKPGKFDYPDEPTLTTEKGYGV